VLLAAVAVALSTVLGPSATGAGAASFGPYPLGFFSVPFSDTLYWARMLNASTVDLQPATFADWQSQGFPAPTPVGAVYEKAPWSDAVVATPQFPGAWSRSSFGRTRPLTFEQWARAGYPAPRVTTNPTGTVFYAYSNDPTVYAQNPALGADHALTFAEWLAAGAPTPVNRGPAVGTTYHQWETSPEIFMIVGERVEKLTYSWWVSLGHPTPVRLPGGFYKLTWDPSIAYVGDDGEAVLTFGDWTAEGFPTPLSVPSIPGDVYCYDAGSGLVFYDGLTVTGEMDAATAEQRLGVAVAAMEACSA
jgi:hypothetical protein